MSIAILRSAAVEWLRYERKCALVCLERTPINNDWCNPDVVGVTSARRVTEIEIKRTMSDFRANREKRRMAMREWMNTRPSQFYFLVPPELVDKVKAELQPHEGLLTVGGQGSHSRLPEVKLIRAAAVQKSRKLSIQEVIKMVRHQTGTLSSALVRLARQEHARNLKKLTEKVGPKAKVR